METNEDMLKLEKRVLNISCKGGLASMEEVNDLSDRIGALEAQAKNDNEMTFAKAPNFANKLLEAFERIEAQQAQINKLDQALANRDTELIMLREKHNALCDVIDAMLTYVRPNMQADYHKAVRLARIKTGDTEAQDEPQDCENDVDAEVNVWADTHAIMGELRKVISRALYENRVTMAESESDDVFYAEEWELPTEAVLREVRPIIERLAERAEQAESLANYWQKRTNQAEVLANRNGREVAKMRNERDSAQAEVAELKEQLGETQYACDGAEDERDKALAEVVRLRDLLKAMPHLGEAHEGYVQAVNEALAEGNDNG